MDLFYLVILKDGKVRVEPVFVDSTKHGFSYYIKEGERLITARSETYADEAAQVAFWAQQALDLQAELTPQLTFQVDAASYVIEGGSSEDGKAFLEEIAKVVGNVG